MNLLSAKFKLALNEFTLKVEIEIPVHGFTVLFGPSGSGKTSFLRCISGLERAPEGFLQIGDETWQEATKRGKTKGRGFSGRGFSFRPMKEKLVMFFRKCACSLI